MSVYGHDNEVHNEVRRLLARVGLYQFFRALVEIAEEEAGAQTTDPDGYWAWWDDVRGGHWRSLAKMARKAKEIGADFHQYGQPIPERSRTETGDEPPQKGDTD
jgi:hypothetical protein